MTTIMAGPMGLIRKVRRNTLLKNSCAVSAIATTTSAKQGEIRAWPTVTQTLPCMHMSLAAAIHAGMYPDETSAALSKVILLEWDAVVTPGSHIEIDEDGVTWSVEGDITPPGSFDLGIALQVVRAPL